MKSNRKLPCVMGWVASVPLLVASGVGASAPLADAPLFLGGNLAPNVFFTLDDSGSMQWEAMPDGILYAYYMFPRATSIYGGSDYTNRVVDFDPANWRTAFLRSNYNNKIYYNPQVTYTPWSNADGSLMPNASITCAPHNPANPGAGCRNLTINNTQSAAWLKSDGSFTSTLSKTFYPAVYFRYNSGSTTSASSYTQVNVISTTPTYTGGDDRSDCAAKPTCTYAEEIQNFANWYTYYRSRILLSRAGVGRAFSAQGENMRVGFGAINKGSATIDGVSSTGTIISGVRPFSGTNRTAFFNSLYTHVMPAASTPLRTSLNQVGKYFQRTDDAGPWGESPGSSGGTQHECRQSYNILMTDGYYNDSFSSLGNVDGAAGTTIVNDSAPADPADYTYSPALPYSDSYSNTLADVAMYYWKNDLRPGLLNKVPTSTPDPAFWQHLVNYTVGLGVSGTLTALPTGSGTWPDPASSSPAKIDDLWHAAVNSRGDFFSAADPEEFADALSGALTSIVNRTASASAVASSSSSLNDNSRVYYGKFNSGDWSGHLVSIPIDTNGDYGSEDWDAAALLDTLSPASRVILTKGGSGDGVSFEYAGLSTSQQANLDMNAAGVYDGCGPERVAYLRGDSSSEGLSGTLTCASSSIVIDRFRVRVTSKLGDIVNSSPVYVGNPAAGFSDVDHPGYKEFSSDSGYKGRLPVVYVGANDGGVHGFNACIADVTPGCTVADAGKEVLAYIPSMVYSNLSRLTSKDYNANHRYLVDGSPMVMDVNLGTDAAPNWRTVLAGGLNGGGKGYYALDVTNPADTTKVAPTFTAANAASIALWEFTSTDDADMGYSYNLAPRNYEGLSRQFVKMENGQWALVVGNGYNSDSGVAALYILFVKGGVDGTWTIGTDYIKLVADASGSNGLSAPMPFDSDGNGLADVIYAGDLKGNLWSFDVKDTTPGNWDVALGGVPLFEAGSSKPIISPPLVTWHPNGGQLVFFGTGKYLETADIENVDTQTFYAVWDIGTAVTTSQLVQQSVLTLSPLTVSTNTVAYSTTSPVVKGWYMNWAHAGERMAGMPDLKNGYLLHITLDPSTSPCDRGGASYLYVQDYLTGGMLPKPVLDTSGDGLINTDDSVAAGIGIAFAPGGITRLSGAPSSDDGGGGGGSSGTTTKDLIVTSDPEGGEPINTLIDAGEVGLSSRITWRELIGD